MIFKQNLTHKNSDIKVNHYNNSSSRDIRKNKMKNIISNYNKILYNSNTKSEMNNNNIKYITINESRNSLTAKRLFKTVKNNEESKVDENNDYKKEKSKIILPNQRKNNSNYFSINYLTKRSSINKNFIDENKFLDNKSITKLNTDNNIHSTLDQKNRSKKFNKTIVKKIKNFNLINNIHSSTINNYQIYQNNINKASSRTNTESNNFIKTNMEHQNKVKFVKRNNKINVSNKRNKQRKNYKFSEINENMENKYHNNINKTIKNNEFDKNEKRCICSLGKNSIDYQIILMKNNNNNSKPNLTKNIYNHNLPNLSYTKYSNYNDKSEISLSPLKSKKENNYFSRLATLNKKGNAKEVNLNELINRTTTRKKFLK
jgi:hypothetical protein